MNALATTIKKCKDATLVVYIWLELYIFSIYLFEKKGLVAKMNKKIKKILVIVTIIIIILGIILCVGVSNNIINSTNRNLYVDGKFKQKICSSFVINSIYL